MFLLGSLTSIFIRVARSDDFSTETISACVNKDAEECVFANWQNCIDSDEYFELCCWSCQTIALLAADVSSCFAGGWHDIMTDSECANAALTNQMTFIILQDEDEMVKNPLGCSKVDENRDIFQWNPALRADDYDYSDYEGNDGPLRVCLRPRRTVEDNEDEEYRKYVPAYFGVRSEMVLPDDWENDGTIRFIENAFTCADVEGSCQIVPNEENCVVVADEFNIAFDVDSIEYAPGGCYYYDETVWWNSGDTIEFPPQFTTAYYSHFCYRCKKDTCPLPLWTQLSLVALSLTVVFVTVVVICFNLQKKASDEDSQYEPAAVVSPVNRGLAQPEGVSPKRGEQNNLGDFDYANERKPLYPQVGEYDYPTEGKPMYPQVLDSWDMPSVPMNLGNNYGY